MVAVDLVGHTLGQYELRELLGAGGMGSVYRAYQANLKRAVAIKVLSANLALQPGYSERFNREAEVAAALEHPNIVPILDYGTHDNISYVVMRLLTGGALNDRIRRIHENHAPQPSLREIAHLLSQLASALDYAHSHGVIHRDIKPSNVMFDNHGNAYIVDFGIAKIMEGAANITGTGATMGTPAYMSPEQWMSDSVTTAADQYALAVMAYELVTGHVPFEAATPYALMNKHLHEKPTPVQALRHDLPEALDLVLERAMAKEPDQRFASVTAFAQTFEGAIRGAISQDTGFFTYQLQAIRAADSDGATKVSLPHLRTSPAMKKSFWLPLAIVGGLIVVALIAGILMSGGDSQEDVRSHTTNPEIAEESTSANAAANPLAPTSDPLLAAAEGIAVTFEDEFNNPNIDVVSWSSTDPFPAGDGIAVIEAGSMERLIPAPANGFVMLFKATPGNMRISLTGGPGPIFWSFTLAQSEESDSWQFELNENGDISSVGTAGLLEETWYYYLVRMMGSHSLQVQIWQRDQPGQFIVNEIYKNDLILDTYIYHSLIEATEGAFYLSTYKELLFSEDYNLSETPATEPNIVIGAAGVRAYEEPDISSAQKTTLSGNTLALLGISRDRHWYLASDGNDLFWIPQTEQVTAIKNPFLHIPTVLEVPAQSAHIAFPAGVQVLLHEDFEASSDSLLSWEIALPENIEVAHSYATINGGSGPNNTAMWRDGLDVNQGFLALFQYQPGDMQISFFSTTEPDGNFNGYILQYANGNTWHLTKRPGISGRSISYHGDYTLEPGKWYYVLMWVDEKSNAFIQLWEPDAEAYLINQVIEGDGIGRRWASMFNIAINSTLILDHYTELAFPMDYEAPVIPPASLETNGNSSEN